MSEDDDGSVDDAGPDFRAGVVASDLLEDAVLAGGQVHCLWHQARFAVATGEPVGASSFEPLPCFAVEERDSRIHVTGRPARPERRGPAAEPPSLPRGWSSWARARRGNLVLRRSEAP